MKLKMQGSGSVDVAEAAFGADFQRSACSPGRHRIPRWWSCRNESAKKTVRKLVAAAPNHGGKKARVALAQERFAARSGLGVAVRSQPSRAATSRRSTRRCIARHLRSVLSELVRQDRLVVVKELALDAPKTKELATKLKELNLNSVLILNEAFDEKIYLAARNLANVGICDAASVDPVVLIRFEKVLVTLPALKLIEERLS